MLKALIAEVGGPPPSMGSKRAFVNPKTGRAVLVDQNALPLRQWQDAMRAAMRKSVAVDAASRAPDILDPPNAGPWCVEIMVQLGRPASHYTAKRLLRGSAPAFPTVKPDLDKVARAALDCGSGILWFDDKQVVTLKVTKKYTEMSAVIVIAEPLERGR